eukprot:GHVT01045972.1.p1 GENE.GHVT01045972.1~~GHVT01045972.1.p1  ORF type:complete len:347 (+),score=90.19 GHVT01045972.1:609-1649(+)
MAPMPGGIRLGEFIPGVFKGRPRGGGGDEASSSASSSTRARTKKPELDELLAKVQAIQNECEEQDKIVRRDENLREVRDPFLKTKGQIYAKIEEARERIKLRNDTVRDKGGGCHASIRLRHQIEDLLIRLRADFKQLCDIYAQQYRSRMRLRLKEDELEKRYQDLNVIKRGIRETQEAFKDTRDFSQNQIKTLTDLQTEHNQRIATAAIEAGIAVPEEVRGRGLAGLSGGAEEPSAEELETLARWKERDRAFDQQLEDVGAAIDRIGTVTVAIGERVEGQNNMALEMQDKAEAATDEITAINYRLKSIMSKTSSSTCCCRVCLILLVLILGCFTFAMIYNQFIKPK